MKWHMLRVAGWNDRGKDWARAQVDEHGAWQCQPAHDYRGDVGSPGKVVLEQRVGAAHTSPHST